MVPQINFAPSTRFNAVWNRFRTLLQQAIRAQVLCMLAGVRKSAWTYPAVEQLKADQILYHSMHRWCHFGITQAPGSEEPSSVNMHLLSSVKITNHSCKCPDRTNHCFDIDSSQPNRAHLRANAERRFCVELLTALGVGQESEMPTDSNSIVGRQDDVKATSLDKTTAIAKESRHHHFPTEQKIAQREREKNMSKEELKARKKKQKVEQHFDDCGTSLAGLGEPELSLFEEPVDKEITAQTINLQQMLTHFTFEGGFGSHFFGIPDVSTKRIRVEGLEQAMLVASQLQGVEPCVDIMELCGGEGLTTFLCHKKRLRPGANFDIITGVDLTQEKSQRLVREYVRQTRPKVAVMAPICGPFGPLGGRNRVLHHESWLRSCETAVPLAAFCGVIADEQLSSDRHFLAEQPFPSKLYLVDPWPAIRSDPRCVRVVFDQCMVGQTVKGWPVKKPTELLASHPILLKRFVKKICHNEHQHVELLGGLATHAQKWSREMCNRIAMSIKELVEFEQTTQGATNNQVQQAYPTVGTHTESNPEGEEQPMWRKCKGCLWRLHKHSPQHSRKEGECKHAGVEPLELDCPGCRMDRPRSHGTHTFGPGCRHVLTSSRESGVRESRAPRPARVPAIEDPTSQLRHNEQDLEPMPHLDEDRIIPVEEAGESGASSSSGPRGQIVRHVPGETQTPDIADWTKFDMQAALRELHFGSQAARLRALRRLHLRWWHSGSTTMTKILRAAGVPADVIELIPSICDTCRICRAWNRPNNSVASARLVTSFNQEVEADIVYVKHGGTQHMFMHCVDRATRWCATQLLQNRTTETLVNTLDTMWVTIFGPMKVLIFDGETGLDDEASTWYFQVRGIEKRTSAVHQHTRIADRRVQILRLSIHKIITQLSEEGITMPFVRILAEATFVINALSNVSGASPYVAVLGRSPALLPELGPQSLTNDDRDEQCPIRHAAKLRTLAISTITENTARERLRSALKTPTKPSGEELKLNVGDSVEYYREPTQRDVSGWRGPATVVDLTRLEHGRVGVRTSTDQVLNCRVQDIRHRLAYLTELQAPLSSSSGKAQEYLQEEIEQLKPGTVLILGHVMEPSGRWLTSSQSTKHGMMLQAALFVAAHVFQLSDVAAVRIARGVKSLSTKPEYTHALTLWWGQPMDRSINYLEADDSKLFTESLLGERWQECRVVQFLSTADTVACVKDNWSARTDHETPEPAQVTEDRSDAGRLSTIPEESQEDERLSQPSQMTADSQVRERVINLLGIQASEVNTCKNTEEVVNAVALELSAPQTVEVSTCGQSYTGWTTEHNCEIPSWSFVARAAIQDEDGLMPIVNALGEFAPEDAMLLDDYQFLDADCTGVYVAVDVEWPFSKAIEGLEQEPCEGDIVELRFYEAHGRKAVIDRSDDLLTKEEMKTHAAECLDAVQAELQTWKDLKCFTRRPRSEAPTIIDTKWVFKWKHVGGVRKIRARLTLRGFKESGADEQSNYAATATKWSQRLIVSECVLRKWHLASTDISKAFLQGVTYQELAKETNAPLRDVSFELCNRAASVLGKLPGMEGFDPQTEVLHCLKPGTGCRDAPRCFAIKLRHATEAYGLKSTLVDSELEMLWDPQTKAPALLVLKHVDDLKIAGPPEQIEKFVHHLTQTFGKLEIHWHQFTFCGIKHIQDPNSLEIELNQSDFLKVIKPMSQPEVACKPGTEVMPEHFRKHFLSLLMTIAYAVQSRPDIAVYIAALQKECQTATYESARKLNKVLLWAQKNPKSITYAAMSTYPDALVLVSDSAFKARETDGLSMRGLVCLRMQRESLYKTGPVACHLLHTVSKSQRHVTRSTFASELFAANDSMDFGLVQRLSLHELTHGHITWEDAKVLQEEPWKFSNKLMLVVDAKSVTAAVTSPTLKAPAECSTLVAIAWLRQKLHKGELSALFWSDTRAMIADGLTKGSINRKEIHAAMKGLWNLMVELEEQRFN